MRLSHRVAVLTMMTILGAGCVRDSAPTVEYFRGHPKERVAQLQRCANDPGSLAESPACVNAEQADALDRHDSLRNLPSMGLQEHMEPSPPPQEAERRQAQ